MNIILSASVSATVVEVRTVEGDFQINLFDELTPLNVENFLSYVNSGAYTNNVIHRSSSNFVLQMGGFQYTGTFPPDAVPAGLPVNNEPVLSNVRGTIAFAKLSGNPNSATSQFFINLSNNSANLDVQNSGFTVFGQVIGDGMDVVDRLAELDVFQFSTPYTELPLRNYTATDFNANVLPNEDTLVLISDVVVTDAAANTNPDLNPTANTLINADSGEPTPVSGNGGGSVGIGVIFILLIYCFRVMRNQAAK